MCSCEHSSPSVQRVGFVEAELQPEVLIALLCWAQRDGTWVQLEGSSAGTADECSASPAAQLSDLQKAKYQNSCYFSLILESQSFMSVNDR